MGKKRFNVADIVVFNENVTNEIIKIIKNRVAVPVFYYIKEKDMERRVYRLEIMNFSAKILSEEYYLPSINLDLSFDKHNEITKVGSRIRVSNSISHNFSKSVELDGLYSYAIPDVVAQFMNSKEMRKEELRYGNYEYRISQVKENPTQMMLIKTFPTLFPADAEPCQIYFATCNLKDDFNWETGKKILMERAANKLENQELREAFSKATVNRELKYLKKEDTSLAAARKDIADHISEQFPYIDFTLPYNSNYVELAPNPTSIPIYCSSAKEKKFKSSINSGSLKIDFDFIPDSDDIFLSKESFLELFSETEGFRVNYHSTLDMIKARS